MNTAAIVQHAPIAVKSATGFWTAAGVWTGVILGVLTLLGIIVKAWPRLLELLIGQRRNDLDDMRKRIGDLEAKVELASTAAHAAEMKLVYAVAAVQLLAANVRARSPDDPTLKQAMELLAAATSGGLSGWAGKLADGVDRIKGTGE